MMIWTRSGMVTRRVQYSSFLPIPTSPIPSRQPEVALTRKILEWVPLPASLSTMTQAWGADGSSGVVAQPAANVAMASTAKARRARVGDVMITLPLRSGAVGPAAPIR